MMMANITAGCCLRPRGRALLTDKSAFTESRSQAGLSHIGASDKKKTAMAMGMKLYIQYLRSVEDSERTRRASVTYLQNWYEHFYPERADIVAEFQSLAAELGGKMEEPRLRWKFAWMKPLFGWKTAKWAQRALPQFKATCLRNYDKTVHRLQSGRSRQLNCYHEVDIQRMNAKSNQNNLRRLKSRLRWLCLPGAAISPTCLASPPC